MAGRRAPGLSGLPASALSAAYTNHGTNLRENHLNSLKTQLSVFQQLLHQFSITHGKEIRKNPQFRAEFARMCNAIGVDPLASSHRKEGSSKTSGGSVWAQMLGESVNDFYFGLAVRIVQVCRSTRAENGGMIPVEEVRTRVQKGRGELGGEIEVSEDDIKRAVESLEPLGSGFTILMLGSVPMIRSVPRELNIDQSTVLEAIQVLGYVTISMLRINLNWEKARALAVMDDLVAESLVWVDTQGDEKEYWTPTIIRDV
ncbi:EAP30 family protein Dot2 [Microthyrium microscopicum]|uniref:Vacuolar-sorting protein SNF8 n=1 Tax=Microthyrium microscopicum TaxID=703497 RepID=A0A6A6TZ88_9PEZI|nr:EAP30 family protein Dot2 [Microthyrium microscopicum]